MITIINNLDECKILKNKVIEIVKSETDLTIVYSSSSIKEPCNSYMLIHYADDIDNQLIIDPSFNDLEDVKSVKYSNVAYVEMWMPNLNGGGLELLYFNTKQPRKKVRAWIDIEIESRADVGEHYITYSKKLKDFLGQ